MAWTMLMMLRTLADNPGFRRGGAGRPAVSEHHCLSRPQAAVSASSGSALGPRRRLWALVYHHS
eukprot:scaffold175454_cov17-Prasinocladus_malaysianus.AAC.1